LLDILFSNQSKGIKSWKRNKKRKKKRNNGWIRKWNWQRLMGVRIQTLTSFLFLTIIFLLNGFVANANQRFWIQRKEKRVGEVDEKLIQFNNKLAPSEPIYFRDGSAGDRWVYREVFEEEVYKLPFFYPVKTVVDLGANIGLFSVYIKSKFPQSRVVAVEPDADNIALFRKNTQHLEGIELEEAGIWHSDTKLDINRECGHPCTFFMEENKLNGAINGVCMDTLVHKYGLSRIDLLKVDIEGGERALFSRNNASWLKRVKIIQIEIHDSRAPGAGQAFFHAVMEVFGLFYYFTKGNVTTIVNRRIPWADPFVLVSARG
jgi:FkbM family methyltransferase